MEHLWVTPWVDAVTEASGHDPRSPYAERYWLNSIGPTSLWLMRFCAYEFDANPDGWAMDTVAVGLSLGISPKSGVRKTVDRLIGFHLVARGVGGSVVVRRALPPLNRSQKRRLPAALQKQYPKVWGE